MEVSGSVSRPDRFTTAGKSDQLLSVSESHAESPALLITILPTKMAVTVAVTCIFKTEGTYIYMRTIIH
jgi:hypothetical protein